MTSYSRLLAVLAASLLVSACMDASGPTRLEDTARLSLLPRFSGVSGAVEPINLIRATVESGGRLLHTQDFTVSPDDGTWNLVLDVPLTGAEAEAVVTLVLIHRMADGTELPQFSGQQTVSLTAGAVSSPQPVTLFQGGPENLDVTGVTLVSAPATLLEGSTAQALATATTQGADPPQIFWTSSDPSRATVDGQGVITGLLPGTVTITARAGAHSASADLTVRALPASVRLDAPGLILTAIGSAGLLRAEVLDARAQVIPGAALEWVVGDSDVAEHLGDGRFRAHAAGVTAVTIRAVDRPSVEAHAVVEVAQRAARVIVEPGTAQSSAHGDEVAFTGRALDVNGHTIAGAALQWTSSNTSVATVDGAGIATTHADGQTVITASLDGASAAAILSVAQRAAAVEVDPSEHTLESLGATVHLTGRALDAAGSPVSGVALSWSSSAPSVAQVDGSGVVTALANGTATITARTGTGATGTALITVAQRPVSLEIQPADALIPSLGGTLTFTAVGRDANGNSVAASAMTWSSSNPAVATVDAAGTATGIAKGTAVITGESGGISATATLTVEQRAARIVVTPGYALVDARGATHEFEASAFDARGNPIPDAVFTWQSMNPAVASVDENGTATAVGEGSAGISARSGDAIASALLEVRQVAAELSVAPGQATIEGGEQVAFEAVLLDRLGNKVGGRSVSWSSSDTQIATIDDAGVATGIGAGSTTITAEVEDLSATAELTVEGGGIPTPGKDIVVFNDGNTFDSSALGNPNNHMLIRNLVNFTSTAPRGSGTRVWMDFGRSSSWSHSRTSGMQSIIAGEGYAVELISSSSGSLISIPPDVKVIVLWMPNVDYTVGEINALKQYAEEGGRIIFVGEHEGYYGSTGIALENRFLANMGAVMRNTGGAVDCGYNDLPASSLRPHQVTAGMTGVRLACASVIEPGPGDFPLIYDDGRGDGCTGNCVLAGVAQIDTSPIAEMGTLMSGAAPGEPKPGAPKRILPPGTSDPTRAPLRRP